MFGSQREGKTGPFAKHDIDHWDVAFRGCLGFWGHAAGEAVWGTGEGFRAETDYHARDRQTRCDTNRGSGDLITLGSLGPEPHA